MNVCWKELLALLPPAIRCEVMTRERELREELTEVRLGLGRPPRLVTGAGETLLEGLTIGQAELSFCVNHVSGFSAYAASGAAQGYLTARGGHRVGLCGQAVVQNGEVTGLRELSSLCIRVARDVQGIAGRLLPWVEIGSLLLIGPPGSGKTTLLRDLIREISDSRGETVSVVDERGEIFPMTAGNPEFYPGKRTDILTGAPKALGMEQVLRSMGPQWIAVDEITAMADCRAMEQGANCGVRFLATAHAAQVQDLSRRPVYRTLLETGIFCGAAVLRPDRTYQVERIRT